MFEIRERSVRKDRNRKQVKNNYCRFLSSAFERERLVSTKAFFSK
jgi:hypothetical protein